VQVPLSRLLQVIENAGLQQDDPRLEASVSRMQHYLRHRQRHRQTDDRDRQTDTLMASAAAADDVDDVMLDRDEFNDCIQHRFIIQISTFQLHA